MSLSIRPLGPLDSSGDDDESNGDNNSPSSSRKSTPPPASAAVAEVTEEDQLGMTSLSESLYDTNHRSMTSLVILAIGQTILDLSVPPWSRVKYTQKLLAEEISRRATLLGAKPSPRPRGWLVPQCMTWLLS